MHWVKVFSSVSTAAGSQVATERNREHCVTERESIILGNFERGFTDLEENARELEPGFDFMAPVRLMAQT